MITKIEFLNFNNNNLLTIQHYIADYIMVQNILNCPGCNGKEFHIDIIGRDLNPTYHIKVDKKDLIISDYEYDNNIYIRIECFECQQILEFKEFNIPIFDL